MDEKINPFTKEQIVTLTNRNNLTITGTNKVVSLKNDLIQLDTVLGGVMISGNNLELVTLDNTSLKAEISGNINSIKYVESSKKENLFRKMFK